MSSTKSSDRLPAALFNMGVPAVLDATAAPITVIEPAVKVVTTEIVGAPQREAAAGVESAA